MLIAASKSTSKQAESRNAMNTIRRYAADDAHVIFGTACDETLGGQLCVTVIATGLSSARKQQATPPLNECLARARALRGPGALLRVPVEGLGACWRLS